MILGHSTLGVVRTNILCLAKINSDTLVNTTIVRTIAVTATFKFFILIVGTVNPAKYNKATKVPPNKKMTINPIGIDVYNAILIPINTQPTNNETINLGNFCSSNA